MTETQLGVEALASALMSYGRHREFTTDQAEYVRARYQALCDLLDVTVDPYAEDDSPFEDQILLNFMKTVAESSTAPVNPFGGCLEAPRRIVELYQLYGKRYAEAEERLNEAGRDLLVDCYRLLIPGIDRRSTNESAIRARGVVPSSVHDEWDDL